MSANARNLTKSHEGDPQSLAYQGAAEREGEWIALERKRRHVGIDNDRRHQ